MENKNMKKKKTKSKVVKRILIVFAIIIGVIMIAGVGIILHFRSQFTAHTVEIGNV